MPSVCPFLFATVTTALPLRPFRFLPSLTLAYEMKMKCFCIPSSDALLVVDAFLVIVGVRCNALQPVLI